MISEKRIKTCGNMELVELSPFEKKLHRIKNHIQKDGVIKTLLYFLTKTRSIYRASSEPSLMKNGHGPKNDETLNLQLGEWVEIKSAEEITETLDQFGKHKGLSFMPEMWKYCGGQFRVYKRVNQIVIIGTESMKKLKNTVLLEGVLCDGSEHSCCDNSCFHYWREMWLRRIPEPATARSEPGDAHKEPVQHTIVEELSAEVHCDM
ncbi:MAG: hypothetical protein ACYC9O_16800 [Candidatus Latescibacterota bacterium]